MSSRTEGKFQSFGCRCECLGPVLSFEQSDCEGKRSVLKAGYSRRFFSNIIFSISSVIFSRTFHAPVCGANTCHDFTVLEFIGAYRKRASSRRQGALS